MRRIRLVARSALLWCASILHFVPGGLLLVMLGLLVDPRRFDPLLRLFIRNQLRLTGARLEVRRAPGFDPERTAIFVCNHVNTFDPFVAYSAVPQFLRGLELESHFRVPVYGWMMKSYGNVPVPVRRSAAALRTMKARFREVIESGTSLLVFPEGTRTRTGELGPFRPGIFRLARELGAPIVPMTQVGAFELKRVGSWLLRPSRIVVHLHDPIETAGLGRADEVALRNRVREIVAGPLTSAAASPSRAGRERTDP